MKRKMLCGNEVSESRESSKITNSSCNSFIDDGTNVNGMMLRMMTNNSKARSRSYCGNRFSSSFYQQRNHELVSLTLLVMLLSVCLNMPFYCNAMTNNTNETKNLLTNSPKVLEHLNNQEVSNEISMSSEENQKSEISENIIESAFGETLEDTIRNAVKNDIEMQSNNGSPALINALNVLRETGKIDLVEYLKATAGSLAATNVTLKLEPKDVLESREGSAVETETSCDANSLVCKLTPKQASISTTALPNLSLATETLEATTIAPTIELEAISTFVPTELETTITPLNNIPQEVEFEVIEDNMPEVRNFENKDAEHETFAEETKTALEIQPELNKNKVPTIAVAPSKDALKTLLPNAEDAVNGEINIDEATDTNAKAETSNSATSVVEIEAARVDNTNIADKSTTSNVEINSQTQNSISANLVTEATEAVKSETEAKDESNVEQEAAAKKENSSSELLIGEDELTGLINKPLIEQLELATTFNYESSTNSEVIQPVSSGEPAIVTIRTENNSRNSLIAPIENIFLTPKPINELATSELTNNILTPTSAEVDRNVIIPVVVDHADIFENKSTNPPIALENANTVTNNKNDTLSLVFEEPLNATEPNILLENPLPDDLLTIEAVNINNLSADIITIQPDISHHNVIKKQGVEPIIEDTTILTTPTASYTVFANTMSISSDIYDYPVDATEASSDNKKNVAVEPIVLKTEAIATTIPTIENNAANDITEVSVVFAGKNDNVAVSTAKGSRSINSLHIASTEQHHKASVHVDAYPAGQTFHENLSEEMPNGIGKALPTHRLNEDASNRSTLVIALSSCITILFIIISVTIFMVSFQRQHGTLDIEMQEQRCGKNNGDEETETCIKLLEIELPKTSLALKSDAEAEIEECL